MRPFKTLRKFLAALRGGATFRQLFLGALFGFALGMTPGINLTFFIFLALILFLNTNGPFALLSFTLGKMLCLLLAPLTFQTGYFLIHYLGFGPLVAYAYDTPFLALLNLQIYCLIGALPFIIFLGFPYSYFVSQTIVALRKKGAKAKETSPWVRSLAENKAINLLLNIIVGRQTQTLEDMEKNQTSLWNVQRMKGAVFFIFFLIILQGFYLDYFAKTTVINTLERLNKAEVNIREAKLSLVFGKLTLYGLEVTDAEKPSRNLVQSAEIESDISILALFKKRIIIDRFYAKTMAMDAARLAPGKVYGDIQPKKNGKSWSLPAFGEASKYLKAVKELGDKLDRFEDYLSSQDEKREQGPESSAEIKTYTDTRQKLLAQTAAPYLAKTPSWVIETLLVEEFKPVPDFPGITVEAKNLSSHPSLYPNKMDITVKPNEEILKKIKEGAEKTGRSTLDELFGK